MNQNENLIYTKVEKVDSSGLLAIDFFKNEAGYNKYFTTGKVENKNALGRDLSKKYLRLYLGMYKEKLPASTVVISYLTDEGIKFTDFEIPMYPVYKTTVLGVKKSYKRRLSLIDGIVFRSLIYGVWVCVSKNTAQNRKKKKTKAFPAEKARFFCTYKKNRHDKNTEMCYN